MNNDQQIRLNEMAARVRRIISAELGPLCTQEVHDMIDPVARVILCIEGGMNRTLPGANQHWFVVTSTKALRAAYHGVREAHDEKNKVPSWPSFSEGSTAAIVLGVVASHIMGVEIRVEDDEQTVVLLNMRMIRAKGYRLSHIKFTESLPMAMEA